MNILLLDMGFVGTKTAELLKQNGYHVTGTTTTPSKVDALKAICDDVLLVHGSEADKIKTPLQKRTW